MQMQEAAQGDDELRSPVPDAMFNPEMRTALRLVTWNLNHWRQPLLPTDTRRAAWDYLSHRIGAGVALVQEAVPPLELERDRAVYGEIAGHRNWGSAVVALDPGVSIEPLRAVRIPWTRRRFLLANTHPGSVAIARLLVPGIQPITLVSVYGVLDGSPVSTMHRIIADLIPLFDSPHGARVILGGDLNVSSSSKDPRQIARAEAVFAAIRSLGLVEAKSLVAISPASPPDCPCGNGGTCTHLATWANVELDHLFVSPSLGGQLTALSVDTAAVEAGLSDHAPIALDLALSPERTPQTWDEESFAEEIGRRHGPAARDVVEKLVNWAERKERELAATMGVCTKVLTRFPTNGCTAEPELMFPVDLNLEPRGSQPTISIHADGTVVVWLGAMRLPPFDTESARHELRRAINELDGVHLPSRQVNGWPRFPISALENTANLVRFVSVLDRIASESHTVRPIAGPRTEEAGDPVTTIGVDKPATTGV
jgi:endonuclease/exonuclease/phosphatase family metal-dependent hydrolase